MLGHRHGWFAIRLWSSQPGLMYLLNLYTIALPCIWRKCGINSRTTRSKLRYFDSSSVRVEQRRYDGGVEGRGANTLIFEHDWSYFLEIEVARARLRRQVFEIMVHVIASPETTTRVQDPWNTRVELFPRGFISVAEAVAMLALEMCYGLQLKDDTTEYLGLRLTEWLRATRCFGFAASGR